MAQLFVTCLSDTIYPQIARSVVNVLERSGVEVTVPRGQTCCGQPMFNAGYFAQAKEVARHFVDVFAATDGPIICPSGSCAAMVRCHYPRLFADEPDILRECSQVAQRTFEFCEFLVKEQGVDLGACEPVFDGSVTYHHSCHFRRLGMTDEPVRLLQQIKGLRYIPLPRMEQCCGFGGTFSVNYPHLSEVMVADKCECIRQTGARRLIYADAGCAMNITGYAHRIGFELQAMHIAELLDRAMNGCQDADLL